MGTNAFLMVACMKGAKCKGFLAPTVYNKFVIQNVYLGET